MKKVIIIFATLCSVALGQVQLVEKSPDVFDGLAISVVSITEDDGSQTIKSDIDRGAYSESYEDIFISESEAMGATISQAGTSGATLTKGKINSRMFVGGYAKAADPNYSAGATGTGNASYVTSYSHGGTGDVILNGKFTIDMTYESMAGLGDPDFECTFDLRCGPNSLVLIWLPALDKWARFLTLVDNTGQSTTQLNFIEGFQLNKFNEETEKYDIPYVEDFSSKINLNIIEASSEILSVEMETNAEDSPSQNVTFAHETLDFKGNVEFSIFDF